MADFEEAMAVQKINENTWIGRRPLGLPLPGARGVYGGHLVAQGLLVAMELAPGHIPHSFHIHFIKAGLAQTPITYTVTRLREGSFAQRQIVALQKGKTVFSAMCSLFQKGQRANSLQLSPQPSPLAQKYPDPDALRNVVHTDFVHNAYLDEFVDPSLCPEEDKMAPSERQITLWCKLHHSGPLKDPRFNFVGLGDLSDAAVLTTLARALHLDWNPTLDNPYEAYDDLKDARRLMEVSLNIIHIHHYMAMSLDHTLYFHVDDFDDFKVMDWLTMSYQFGISKNHRTLVRGHFFDPKGNCVATFVQEGLTYMRPGVNKL